MIGARLLRTMRALSPYSASPGGLLRRLTFLLQTENDHGLAGLINLFGIESPGLTVSLAIAARLARRT